MLLNPFKNWKGRSNKISGNSIPGNANLRLIKGIWRPVLLQKENNLPAQDFIAGVFLGPSLVHLAGTWRRQLYDISGGMRRICELPVRGEPSNAVSILQGSKVSHDGTNSFSIQTIRLICDD
ncbi:hypothetical protein NPIL_325301 [Nephila pilipes]|uniref:Uncharacterized protein n=1 Tax=Nephila pilipes TaxID=299642 RepID=A0A8X6MUL9_NEPPI|nr:hypothetical protein NPIL_325301 [Nephila pilipes]